MTAVSPTPRCFSIRTRTGRCAARLRATNLDRKLIRRLMLGMANVPSRIRILLLIGCLASSPCFPERLHAQGETTSAIIGRVTDSTKAVIPDAT